MKIDLKKYFDERDRIKEEYKLKEKVPGPVLTISREYGCEGEIIAKKVLLKLNDKAYKKSKWKIISKEILDESAEKLKLNLERVERGIQPKRKTWLLDIVTGFSLEKAVSDFKIAKVVQETIISFATQGKVIIVGRGGVAIAKDIDRSLHIKLHAPVDWRINKISALRKVNKSEAKRLIEKNDLRRDRIIDNLRGEKCDNSIFDMVLNRATLSEKEIVYIIIKLMEMKKLV